jgi:hypothetical protein
MAAALAKCCDRKLTEDEDEDRREAATVGMLVD